MRTILTYFLVAIFLAASPNLSSAQAPGDRLVGDWTFHPNYTLARHAANYPGEKIEAPKSRFQRFKTRGAPIYFYEQQPTERITDFIAPDRLPTESFSIELWLLNHVNMPVGTLMALRGKSEPEEAAWLLGYYGGEAVFHLKTENDEPVTLTEKIGAGWKKYWGHLVGTYDGKQMKLYLNSKLLAQSEGVTGKLKFPATPQMEIAGYFGAERYMEISNLLKAARLYDHALDAAEIRDRFEELQQSVEAGKLFPEAFHFNAGPYLQYATRNSINLLWETDRLATAEIAYGTSLPLTEKIRIDQAAYIQEVTLEGLSPQTPYYYEITAVAADGKRTSSGVLTFATAVEEDAAFSFCIIGDTESRPHINHRLGALMWEERPNFIMHLGDVTDGGQEDHKFEWNYEYFTGITPVASRIPFFPVPGNGESDLYWYNRYHHLPAPEAYYSFQYGNAEFFMLNSNAREELVGGGRQYEWLKAQLARSSARWKIVAHHHCPVSSDENDFGNTWEGKTSRRSDPRFDDLIRLYESAGVDVVFFGHVHAYERSWPLKEGRIDQENGVVYIKSGGGGGNLEDFTPTPSWFSNKVQRGNHFCKVNIFDGTFSFKMYDTEGRLKDFMELKK
jgi:hypothetical protein